jgi:ABC-type multidrug transport system permease subunit
VREGRVSLEDLQKRLEAMDQGQLQAKSMDPSNRTSGISQVHVLYYAMLAYVAFFPVTVGADAVFSTEANRTAQAMRQTISPNSKRKRFVANLLPMLLFHLVLTCLIFVLAKGLSIDMGPKPQLFLLMMLVMTLASIFTGSMIAACFSFSQTLVIGLSIAIPLFLGFLSGLMANSVRDLLVQKAPWALAINPISRASTGFFVLAAGGPVSLFYRELGAVLIYLAVMLVLTLIGLRRSSYESL